MDKNLPESICWWLYTCDFCKNDFDCYEYVAEVGNLMICVNCYYKLKLVDKLQSTTIHTEK